ncbi:serine-threonine protein kinase, plant-type, putative [Ricinus communis]|uniref:Serine-threonine protein kinase, plant-type, putative n=1 Tax=Ricinus communis TaxID=3988 RepID=B9RGA1_RICCO|nr:serine-threonine protein kinase, plant-type, putative [Ricinus communis]
MNSLVILDLSFNDFDGGIPISFKHLCNLRSLDLTSVRLSQEVNEVLKILSECVSDGLELLSLSECELSGYLTDDLGRFRNFSFLDLSSNLISGPIPRSLKHFCNLKTLNLQNLKLNQGINEGLEILSGYDALESLYLYDSQLSAYLTDRLGHFRNLVTLDLDDNLISGPIPLSLGEMKSLRILKLSL